jgi:AmmeMemoRadiSam system protein A
MNSAASDLAPRLDPEARSRLLELARASIRHGLDHGRPLSVHTKDFPEPLRAVRASFVTLEREGELRGCIGHLEAVEPLVQDVAKNAFAAAFRDPRFPPLAESEFAGLGLHISVLTPSTELEFESEQDLIAKLRPGIDGLILQEGASRGTFLPSVWESLPEPQQFLAHLKRKAGLPMDHWSERIRVFRYETEAFG